MSRLTGPSGTLAGGTVEVRLTVVNRGSARSGRFTARIYLSRDSRFSRGDRALVGRVSFQQLRARRSATVRARLRLPSGTQAGDYVLIACADDRRRVREGRERNNCRAGRGG